MKRERKRKRAELNEEEDNTVIEGVSFDERKDKTLVSENKDGIYHMKTVIEEHVTIVQKPGSKYVGHMSLGKGSVLCIKTCSV